MYKVRAIFHHQVHSYHRIFKNHFRRRVKCPLTVHSLYGTDAGSQFGAMSTMLILIEFEIGGHKPHYSLDYYRIEP